MAIVSIPERVWGGLEPGITAPPRTRGAVSIPERVWGGLERQLCRLPHQGFHIGFNP